jgi:hypothetical protein
LRHRALDGDAMPHGLAQQLNFSTVEYLSHGLRLAVRDVPPRFVVQVQFILAWSNAFTDESPSTWFAVEQQPKDIVHQLLFGASNKPF